MLDAKKYLGEMLAERYLIKREIGRGASSLVFYAEDMMTSDENGRPVAVAVKMTEREAGDAPLNKSFEQELQATIRLPVYIIFPTLEIKRCTYIIYTSSGILFI